jgi:hypothetical protein
VERDPAVEVACVPATQRIADEQSALDFLLIFSSVARGEHGPESDIDVYCEAHDLSERFNRVDSGRHYQVSGCPRARSSVVSVTATRLPWMSSATPACA